MKFHFQLAFFCLVTIQSVQAIEVLNCITDNGSKLIEIDFNSEKPLYILVNVKDKTSGITKRDVFSSNSHFYDSNKKFLMSRFVSENIKCGPEIVLNRASDNTFSGYFHFTSRSRDINNCPFSGLGEHFKCD